MNHEARARKYAFITNAVVKITRKKILFSKHKSINSGEIPWVNPQELASARLKPNKEVQHNGVYGDGCKGNRNVDKGHGGGFYEWMVHRCLLMTQDQGTVSVQSGNFSQ